MRSAPAGRRLLRLQLGDRWFALDLSAVAAIEAGDSLAEASWSGDLIGSLYHGGEEINVHLLAPRLGLPMFSGLRTRGAVVIVRSARPAWGMLCDRVIAETNAAPEIHPVPGACGRKDSLPFAGVAAFPAESGPELAWVLDPDRLHPDDPMRTVPAVRPKSAFAALPPRGVPSRTPPSTVSFTLGERRGQLLMFPLGVREERPLSAGLSYRQVLEVLPMPALTPAPFAAPHVRGICAWRGRVLAVVDVAERLGIPGGFEGREKLVVARATPEGELVGLAAPAQMTPLRLPTRHGRGSPSDAVGPVLGAFELGDRTLLLPDLGALAASL